MLRRADREEQLADLVAVIERAADRPTRERLVVAEYDGEFAGAVHLRVTHDDARSTSSRSCRRSRRTCCPQYRRHGVGRALMDAAVSYAEELGIGHVATAAASGSRDANRFMARLALGPQAVLRVAADPVVRAKLTAQRPRRAPARGGRQLTQVLAARRSMRRSGASTPRRPPGLSAHRGSAWNALAREQRAGDPRGADPLAALVGDHDLVGRRCVRPEVDRRRDPGHGAARSPSGGGWR